MRGWKEDPLPEGTMVRVRVPVPHEGLEDVRVELAFDTLHGFPFPMRGWKMCSSICPSAHSMGSPPPLRVGLPLCRHTPWSSRLFPFPMRGWKHVSQPITTWRDPVPVPHEGLEGGSAAGRNDGAGASSRSSRGVGRCARRVGVRHTTWVPVPHEGLEDVLVYLSFGALHGFPSSPTGWSSALSAHPLFHPLVPVPHEGLEARQPADHDLA